MPAPLYRGEAEITTAGNSFEYTLYSAPAMIPLAKSTCRNIWAVTRNQREPGPEVQDSKLPSTKVDFGPKQSSAEDFGFQPGQLIAGLTAAQGMTKCFASGISHRDSICHPGSGPLGLRLFEQLTAQAEHSMLEFRPGLTGCELS